MMIDQNQKMIEAYIAAGAAGLQGFEPGSITMATPESFAKAGRIMEDADGMLRARRMQNQALTLAAVAEALDADLAVSPLVIATGPGGGTHTMLRSLATTLDLDFRDIRCGQIQPHELVRVHSAEADAPMTATYEIGERILDRSPALVILDEAVAFGPAVATAVLNQIIREAHAPVVAVLLVRRDQVDGAIDVIAEATGIHRALVPVTELMHDPRCAMPAQRVRLVGSLSLTGSRTGERYLEIESAELPETTRFVLTAAEGEDDGVLADVLEQLLAADQVAVTLERDGMNLRCGTRDITAL